MVRGRSEVPEMKEAEGSEAAVDNIVDSWGGQGLARKLRGAPGQPGNCSPSP